jgi:hypothetical protein
MFNHVNGGTDSKKINMIMLCSDTKVKMISTKRKRLHNAEPIKARGYPVKSGNKILKISFGS